MSANAGLIVAKILAGLAVEYAKKWATKKARIRGQWLGRAPMEMPVDEAAAEQAGYAGAECRFVAHDARDPLHFAHESGYDYMFDTPLITDGGSTPKLARKACKDWADLEPFGRFKFAFFFHDAAYRDAGCWVRLPRSVAVEHGVKVEPGASKTKWTWMRLTRGMADTLLFQMMPSLDGRNGEINAIFRAVRVGGGGAWKRHRRRQDNGGSLGADAN